MFPSKKRQSRKLHSTDFWPSAQQRISGNENNGDSLASETSLKAFKASTCVTKQFT